jgi:hypothetical protein
MGCGQRPETVPFSIGECQDCPLLGKTERPGFVMPVTFDFVAYGERFEPQPDTIVLDVGMKTVPGVIDHHHPDAEAECTASLIAKHPELVLDHAKNPENLRLITPRLPDFDALSSIFLTLKLLEIGAVDPAMQTIANYAKIVDSASLPKNIDLAATPYSILRALFSGAKKEESEINRERTAEGGKFMRFLYSKAQEGYNIEENRALFSGVERFERAMRKIEADYFHYLDDISRSQRLILDLPLSQKNGKRRVDGLIVKNPSSFLLRDWARRDMTHPTLREGFSFLLTNFGNQRYVLGVDPDKGVHLKGLGSLLNREESQRRSASGRSFLLPWYEGNCPFFNYRIIDSPQDGTLLSQREIVDLVQEFSRNLEQDG